MKDKIDNNRLQLAIEYRDYIQARNEKGYYSPREFSKLWSDALARIAAIMGLE